MPVFKIWNVQRNKKTAVVAETCLEVCEKGARKLGLDVEPITICLEEDGTMIDDDDVLREFAGKTLLLLGPDDLYQKADACNFPIGTSISTPTATTSTSTLIATTSASTPIATPTPAEPVLVTENDGSPAIYTPTSEADQTEINRQVRAAPLPTFTGVALKLLTDGRPQIDWKSIVSQAAFYYYAKWPKMKDPGAYREIGQKMFQAYPCIAQEGNRPWTLFTNSLSQRIRHIRCTQKQKSMTPGRVAGESSEPPRKLFCMPDTSALSAQPQAEIEVDVTIHLTELKKEWKSKTPNKAHIKMLMMHTQNYRRELLRKYPSGQIKPILEEFPCLKNADYIMYDYQLTVGVKKIKQYAVNFKRLLQTLDRLRNASDEGPLAALETFRYLERTSMYDNRGKGKKPAEKSGGKTKSTKRKISDDGQESFASLLTVHENIPEADVDGMLSDDASASLHIVIFVNGDNELQQQYVVADGCAIQVPLKGGIYSALLTLIMAYYVFDCRYPKAYAMALAVLQIFVTEEPYTGVMSQRCKFLIKDIRQEMVNVPVASVESQVEGEEF